MTAKVTVQSSVRNAIHFVGHRFADGGSVSHSTVNGVPRTTNMTVPLTPIPHYPEGPFIVTATGTGDPIVAGAAGETITVAAGNFTSNLVVMKKEDRLDESPQTTECTIAPDQDVTVDVIQVVAAGGGEDDVELTIQAPATAKAGSGITATFPEAFVGETYGMRLEASLPTGAPTGASQNVAAAAALPTVPLGSHAVGAGGNMPLTIPADAPAGDYYLIASTSDQQYAAWTPISILPADAGPDEGGEETGDGGEEAGDDDVAEDTETGASNLTRTGGSTFLLSGLGALTLMAGGVALVARRRIGSDL
ncbi:MAG: hypothetical protein GX678_06440 [Actinomycetales bacterium]|nr:hypothetical protein [Actinomycetales bacterium]